MIRGTPPYTAFGLTECKIVPEIKLSGSDRWLDKDEVSQRGDRVWGELQWDLSGLDGLETLRVSFELKLDTSLYRESYSEAKILDDIGFGVRLWNMHRVEGSCDPGIFLIGHKGEKSRDS